jgi:hypothetical protein
LKNASGPTAVSWVSFNPDCVTGGNPSLHPPQPVLKKNPSLSLSLSADKLRVKILDRQKSTWNIKRRKKTDPDALPNPERAGSIQKLVRGKKRTGLPM